MSGVVENSRERIVDHIHAIGGRRLEREQVGEHQLRQRIEESGHVALDSDGRGDIASRLRHGPQGDGHRGHRIRSANRVRPYASDS